MHWLYQGIKVASPTIPFVPLGQAYDLRLTLVVPSTDDDVGKVYLCLTDKDYMGQIYAKKSTEWAYKELMPFPYASCLIGALTSGQRVDIDFRIILEDGSQAAQFNIPVAVCSGDDVIEAMPSGVWCGSEEHEPGLWGLDHESRPLWLGGADQCPFHEDGSICVSKDFHWLESGETLYYGDVIYIKPSDRAMYKASGDAETAEGAYAIGLVADGSADLVERFDSAAWADEENVLIFDHGGEVDGTIVNTLSIYDPTTRTWSAGTAGGGARKLHSAVVYDRKAYVYGGVDGSGNYLNSLYTYDLDTGVWTDLGTGGTARADFAWAIIEGKIYIAGGYNESGGVAVTDIYDLSTGEWSTGGSLSNPDQSASANTPTPELLMDDGDGGANMVALHWHSATWVEDETYGGLWFSSDSEYDSRPIHWFREGVSGWDHQHEHEFTGDGFIGGRGQKSCYHYGAIYTLNEEGETDTLYKNELDTDLEDISGVVYPADVPCQLLDRYQTVMDGWLYDVYEGTRTNLSSGTEEEWYRPLVDANYAVVGSKDRHVYVVDAEDYEVEHSEGGTLELNRLVLWVWTRYDNSWAKLILGDYNTPWGDYEDRDGYPRYHTGAASDDAIYLVSRAAGVIDGSQDAALIKIPMLSGNAINSYIVEVGGKILRIVGSTGTLEQYDPATNTWSETGQLKGSVPQGAMVHVVGPQVQLVGGVLPTGENFYDVVGVSSIDGAISYVTSNISSPHVGGNSINMGKRLYAWGGYGSGYQATMDVTDLSSNAWESWDLTKRKVQTQGFFTNESWDLTPGAELYLSTGGNMQEGRPSNGHIVKIGKVISAQTICIDPRYIEYIEPPVV